MGRATRFMLLAVLVVAAGVTVLFRIQPQTPAPGTPLDDRAIEKRPSQWWYEQRAFPFGYIPSERADAARSYALLEHNEARLRTSVSPFLQWQFVGPDNIGGRITAMAVVPGGVTFYIGAANGGVWKSTDAGATWNPIFDEFAAYSIGDVQLDPTNSNILWVGTGESNPAVDTYDGNGLYRSTDGGTSWEHMGLSQVKRIARIAIDPLNPLNMYVAGGGSLFQSDTDGGIWRSTDGGVTWAHTLYVDPVTVGNDIIVNPVNPDTLHAALWDFGPSPATESAVYRSTNYGATWTRLGPADGLPASNDSTDRISLAYAPSRHTTVYAQITHGSIGTSASYNGRAWWRSTDGGATWDRRTPGSAFTTSTGFGGFAWYFGTIAVHPTNPDIVWALGVQALKSTTGGTNFSGQNGIGATATHVDHHAIWINPTNSRTYVGNDGGFYRSTTQGGNWTKFGNIPITQFYAITVDPANANRQFGGTQDNNTLAGSGTTTWTPVLGGDGFYCIVDHTNPAVVFAEYQFMCGGQGPARSVSGGASGTFVVPGAAGGFVSSDRYAWNAPFVMDPTDHDILLAGSHRIYKSTNNGVSYTPISPDLAHNPSGPSVFNQIRTIDISSLDNQLYYTGSGNGKVWRSTNGGTSWEDKTAGLPTRAVTRVTADPHDVNTVYVSMSGFNGSSENPVQLWKSTDRGDSWTNVSGNLPNAPVNDILVDNLDPLRLYAGTDLGVWTTQNGGATWYPLGHGMPFQAIFDLYLHTGTRQLFAGTHGRSMYKLNLAEMPVAVGPRTITKLAMSSPSPNPSRGNVGFSLELDREAAVNVGVFDAQGRRTTTIHRGTLTPGRHRFSWDGRDASGRVASAGVYFLRAEAPGGIETKRIVRNL